MSAAIPLRKTTKPTIGGLIDQMAEIRDKRTELTRQDEVLKAQSAAFELQLIALLDEQKTTKGSNSRYTASIKPIDTYSAPDDGWPIFMEKVVAKNKLWHLVQRRISDPAMRELVGLKGWGEKQLTQLGLKKFTKRSISLTKLP